MVTTKEEDTEVQVITELTTEITVDTTTLILTTEETTNNNFKQGVTLNGTKS